jgi:hypothetical protein
VSDPVEFLDLDDVLGLARRLLGDPVGAQYSAVPVDLRKRRPILG